MNDGSEKLTKETTKNFQTTHASKLSIDWKNVQNKIIQRKCQRRFFWFQTEYKPNVAGAQKKIQK